jgi:hypothetical protein
VKHEPRVEPKRAPQLSGSELDAMVRVASAFNDSGQYKAARAQLKDCKAALDSITCQSALLDSCRHLQDRGCTEGAEAALTRLQKR